jgi:ubiquinone/menaquinone biosynthesis C-methylase UbiE
LAPSVDGCWGFTGLAAHHGRSGDSETERRSGASEIPVRFIHQLYLAYMRLCMPVVGYVATGGDASAYHYLLSGVRGFPGAPQFAEEIGALGFVDVAFQRLSFGIVAIHIALKPAR